MFQWKVSCWYTPTSVLGESIDSGIGVQLILLIAYMLHHGVAGGFKVPKWRVA